VVRVRVRPLVARDTAAGLGHLAQAWFLGRWVVLAGLPVRLNLVSAGLPVRLNLVSAGLPVRLNLVSAVGPLPRRGSSAVRWFTRQPCGPPSRRTCS